MRPLALLLFAILALCSGAEAREPQMQVPPAMSPPQARKQLVVQKDKAKLAKSKKHRNLIRQSRRR